MLYKFYFALRSNKVLLKNGLYIITIDIRNGYYKIWYINGFRLPILFDVCENKDILKFKLNILMQKGGI